ncbi:hypothetical protein RND81_14G129300 [Saponaria officinalis]|uniref:CCHC-type domain-containing protein n=1 Tax=Saponaria officinalis TaxID=3572 RepID=A0AAW1GPX9_SAPOF
MSNIKDMTLKFGKLEKFDGVDFRRWQKKMHFFFTTLKVVYVLKETRKLNKWENDDYICRGHILNGGMSDSLLDVYQYVESATELWNMLESKYIEEDALSKKILVGNFMNYKMSDSRPLMNIIDKLPPSWKDFKHMLKHKKEELSLIQLGGHLRIEESLRDQERNKPGNKETKGSSSINMMEEGESSIRNKGKKRPFQNTKNGPNKRPKGACWICGKSGHFKRDCRGSKDQTPPTHQGQILDCGLNSVKNYVPLISDAFYVQDDDEIKSTW